MGLKSNQGVDAPSVTPTANAVPKAKPDGTLAAGWLPPALEFTVAIAGLALTGGDKTGNTRGEVAVDLCPFRDDPSQVASGYGAIAIGPQCTAAGDDSIAIGDYAEAYGQNGIALGSSTVGQYAEDGIALRGTAQGVASVAIGSLYNARPYLARMPAQFSPLVNGTSDVNVYRTCTSHTLASWCLVGANFTNAGIGMAFPKDVRFFPDKLSVVAESATGVTSQPTVAVTGGSRTAVTQLVVSQALSAPSSLIFTVASSAGFTVGKWLLTELFPTGASLDARAANPREIFKITATTATTVTVQSTSMNGYTGDLTITQLDTTDYNVLAATATTGLTAIGKRWNNTSLSSDGHEVFIFHVTVAGTSSGSFNVKGMMVGSLVEMVN